MSVTILPARVQGPKICNQPNAASGQVRRLSRPADTVRFGGDTPTKTEKTALDVFVQRVRRFFNDLVKAVRRLLGMETPKEKPVKEKPTEKSSEKSSEKSKDQPVHRAIGRQLGKAVEQVALSPTLAEHMADTGKALERILPDLEITPTEKEWIQRQAKLMQSTEGRQRFIADSMLDSAHSGELAKKLTEGLAILNNSISIKDGAQIAADLKPWSPKLDDAPDQELESGLSESDRQYEADDESSSVSTDGDSQPK